MKILFLTYPRIGLNQGGLQIQIEQTAQELTRLGVEVLLYDPWRNQVPEVDLCHVFSIDGAMLWHLQRATQLGKPVVLSPVFSAFANNAWITALKEKLSRFMPGVYSDLKRARAMIDAASRIIALNLEEKATIAKVFPSSLNKTTVIPNGIDGTFAKGDPSLFYNRYGYNDFVLSVGSIEPNKNQLSLIRAIRGLNLPLVIIGKVNDKYRSYYELCRKESEGEKILFVGEISHRDPLLASAYAAAKVFVLPSISEVMPLSLYEAALSGCQIIASHSFPLQPSLRQKIQTFAPTHIGALNTLITQHMRCERDEQIRNIVASMPSWSIVGQRILGIYTDLMNRRPHAAHISQLRQD